MEEQSGNIFFRKNVLEKGQITGNHKHNFDHTTLVVFGAIHVKAKLLDGRVLEQDFYPGEHFLVLANAEHEITSLENNTLFLCIYSHRNPQGEVVQQNIGWHKAYV
jgi:quercetin dioxygenase-like cupin family protein